MQRFSLLLLACVLLCVLFFSSSIEALPLNGPCAVGQLELDIQRFANQPSYRFPWHPADEK